MSNRQKGRERPTNALDAHHKSRAAFTLFGRRTRILPPVKPRPRIATLLWIVAFALIATRASEAHIHFCLDGQEAPSSLHVKDDGPFCDQGSGAPESHQDQDVDAVGEAVPSKSDSGSQALGLLPTLDILLALLPPKRSDSDFGVVTQSPLNRHPYLFLPLLRGPPL
jgi:hypothetical protein